MNGSVAGILRQPDHSDDHSSQYNQVPYPSHAYAETHPDRLAVMALLFGLDPPPVETSRILEIGCGDGSNIIPMAQSLPRADCLGIDFARNPIEIGQSVIRRTGIKNVKCEVLDLRDVTKALGTFDYIVAHGFYSWVPTTVQDKLLSFCRDNLAPAGVAFISYNTYPAGHLRNMSRELMLFHLGQDRRPNLVSRGTAFLREMHDMIAGNSLWKSLVGEELERLAKRDSNATFHDEFSPHYSPVYFKDFVNTVDRFGLQFLSEATLADMIAPPVSPEVSQRLSDLAAEDLILYHQYLDFAINRGFRRTLLCHRAIQLQRDALYEHIERLLIASPLVKSPRCSDGSYEFRSQRGAGSYTTKSPIMLSVLDRLQAIWPHAERFDSLLKRISKHLPLELKRQAVENLAPNLLMLAASELVDLRSYTIPMAESITTHPAATSLARFQAQENMTITTLLHTQVKISDDQLRSLLRLLDGSRDRNALVECFASSSPKSDLVTAASQIDGILNAFYKMGILAS